MGEALYLFGPPILLFVLLALPTPGRAAVIGFAVAAALLVLGFVGVLPLCPPEGLFGRGPRLSCDIYAQVPLRFSVAVMIWVGGAQVMRWRRLKAGRRSHYLLVLAGFWVLVAGAFLANGLGR